MKHVTYGEKAHFMGDEAAHQLLEYASALGNAGMSDTVTLMAVDDHGNSVEASFLLNPSTVLLAESSSSGMTEPENATAIEYMRTRAAQLQNPPAIQPEDRPTAHGDGGDVTSIN